jgi:hypothetical protein
MPGHQMRRVGLEFLEEAAVRLELSEEVHAHLPVVFGAISADPSTWTWFPSVSGGRYEGEPPHGRGSTRRIRVAGSDYTETVLAWEEPFHIAYRLDACSEPIAQALVEDWLVEEVDDHSSLVRWTIAFDPAPGFERPLSPPEEIRGIFSRAMRNLDEQLGR